MTFPFNESMAIRSPGTVEEVHPTTLLGICTSLKPAEGLHTKSAAREILLYALRSVAGIYPDALLIDLRERSLPFFDGRMPPDYDNHFLNMVSGCIDRAGALLLSIPAYWSGVSGVFKNLIDITCGPAYDLKDNATTIFEGKAVGLLIVGADEKSARTGSYQAQQIMCSTGAYIVGQPVVVADPQSNASDTNKLSRDLVALGGELARVAYLLKGATA